MANLRHILGHRFRANPAFELLEADQLPEHFRASLSAGSARLADGVALVPPSDSGITVKILNRQATELVRTVGVVGHLPTDVGTGDAMTNEAIARLVLDGALEIEYGGQLVSGPAAHGAVFDGTARAPATGALAALSRRAIRYGQGLMISDVQVLSRRLYGFGTIPRYSRWDRLLDGADDVVGLLGLTREGASGRVLSKDYEASAQTNWLNWVRVAEHPQPRPNLPYKLYISPRPEALVECFPAVVTILADGNVGSFKVGRGVLGLLRPDKIVAYFEDASHLHRVATTLAHVLDGCPTQGVPFTAQASTDGLVSWGIDPPPAEQLTGSQFRQSWRYWVANRLASCLVLARATVDSVEPWEFALDRLFLEGVDSNTWLPADTLWRDSEDR